MLQPDGFIQRDCFLWRVRSFVSMNTRKKVVTPFVKKLLKRIGSGSGMMSLIRQVAAPCSGTGITPLNLDAN